MVNFQLPLSGSRAKVGGAVSGFIDWITFNSLSRDHEKDIVVMTIISLIGAFNSLSRDHRARFRDFSALRGFLPRHPFAQMNFVTTI